MPRKKSFIRSVDGITVSKEIDTLMRGFAKTYCDEQNQPISDAHKQENLDIIVKFYSQRLIAMVEIESTLRAIGGDTK